IAHVLSVEMAVRQRAGPVIRDVGQLSPLCRGRWPVSRPAHHVVTDLHHVVFSPAGLLLLGAVVKPLFLTFTAVAGRRLELLSVIPVVSVPVGGENDRLPMTAAFAGVTARVATAVATRATRPARRRVSVWSSTGQFLFSA